MFKKVLVGVAVLVSYAVCKAENPLSFYSDNVASVGVVVYDLENKSMVYNYNGNLSLTPASTMKLVSSAAALSLYPADYQYETPAYIDGKIDKGTVFGDIVIKGSGDPTLYSRHFPDNQTFIEDITSSLKDLGVKRISGNIVVDNGDQQNVGKLGTWEIEDGYYEYGTGWYPFNYRDNVFRLNPNLMTAVPQNINLENIVTEVDGKLYLIQSFGNSYNEITGIQSFRDDSTIKLPNPYPSDLFIADLTSTISDSGIEFVNDEENYDTETVQSDSIPLASYYSPALKAIITDLMHRSDNMMAESTLRLLAPGLSLDDALRAEKDLYDSKGIPTDLYTIRDGSGLSRGNAVSPEFFIKVLTSMSDNEDFVDVFPRAGVDGTVCSLFKGTPLEGRAALKSGSMSGVRCYAGYILNDDDEPKYAVAIMVNNFKCKVSEINKSIQDFLLEYCCE